MQDKYFIEKSHTDEDKKKKIGVCWGKKLYIFDCGELNNFMEQNPIRRRSIYLVKELIEYLLMMLKFLRCRTKMKMKKKVSCMEELWRGRGAFVVPPKNSEERKEMCAKNVKDVTNAQERRFETVSTASAIDWKKKKSGGAPEMWLVYSIIKKLLSIGNKIELFIMSIVGT